MKDTLRRFEVFPAFDGESIAAHLEKMAERGWMLVKMGPFFWVYRRTEPRKISFHVSFFPTGSPFDPALTAGEDELGEMCAHAGWKLAASDQRMRVFYNADQNAIPVETDPWVESAAVHSVAMRTAVPMAAMIFLCGVYMLFGAAEGLFGGLSGLSTAFCLGLSILVAVYYALELAAYFTWHIRSMKAALRGERGRYPQIGGIMRGLQWCAFFAVLAWGLGAAVFAAGAERLLAAVLLLAAATFAGSDGLMERLRRAKASPGLNRAVIFCLSAVWFAAAAWIGAVMR